MYTQLIQFLTTAKTGLGPNQNLGYLKWISVKEIMKLTLQIDKNLKGNFRSRPYQTSNYTMRSFYSVFIASKTST